MLVHKVSCKFSLAILEYQKHLQKGKKKNQTMFPVSRTEKLEHNTHPIFACELGRVGTALMGLV